MKFSMSIIAVLVASSSAFAAVEEINGIPTSELAAFAYPGLPISEAINMFRDEYYGYSEGLDRVVKNYNSNLADKLKSNARNGTFSVLDPLYAQELEQRPYLQYKAFGNKSSALTRFPYSKATLHWQPDLQKSKTGAIFGEVNAESLLPELGDFDLERVTTKALDYVVLSQFGLCELDSVVNASCRSGGVSKRKIEPYPYSRYAMWTLAKNDRQSAIPAPPTNTAIASHEVRGLAESARYFKQNIGGNPKLLMSLATDVNRIKPAQMDQAVTSIQEFITKWNYDGIVLDIPNFTAYDISGNTEQFISELRKKLGVNKTIVFNLYDSHQINEDTQEGVLALQADVDHFRLFLNKTIEDEQVAHYAPSEGAEENSYRYMLKKLIGYGVAPSKIIQEVRSALDVRYYTNIVHPHMPYTGPTGWVPKKLSGKAIPGDEKDRPGTFNNGQITYYDHDQNSSANGFKRYGAIDTTNIYADNEKTKTIISGDDHEALVAKIGTSMMYGVNSAHVRLDQDNGKLTNAIQNGLIAGAKQHEVFNGRELILKDDLLIQRTATRMIWRIKHTPYVSSNQGGMSSQWCQSGNTKIAVKVQDENGEEHMMNLIGERKMMTGNTLSWNRPLGNMCTNSTTNAKTSWADTASRLANPLKFTLGDNKHLPPGRYRSMSDIEMELKRWWHESENDVPENKVLSIAVDVTL